LEEELQALILISLTKREAAGFASLLLERAKGALVLKLLIWKIKTESPESDLFDSTSSPAKSATYQKPAS